MNFFDLQQTIITKYPVVLSIQLNGDNIRINSIVIEKSQRNRGYGTAILNYICEYADCNGYTITLTPDSSLGGNLRRLKGFYKRFGFKKYTEYYYTDSHIRYPKGK